MYIYNHQIKLFILVDINVKIINKKPYHFFYYLINELIVEETPFLFLEFRFQRYLLSLDAWESVCTLIECVHTFLIRIGQ